MNRATRAAASLAVSGISPCPVSFFHSTPVLERKRRNSWVPRFSSHVKRRRNNDSKRKLFRDVSDYAEHLFQSWRAGEERENCSYTGGPLWFRRQCFSKGKGKDGLSSQESQSQNQSHRRRGNFNFCVSDDDDDVETIFRAAFGECQFSWSFDSSDNFHCRYSRSDANKRTNWNSRYQTDDETDCLPQSDLASERLALGLRAYGPLHLEEIKSAYRACALRWHPDRHQGSSKAVAEEKFKSCSSAYRSLCGSFTPS